MKAFFKWAAIVLSGLIVLSVIIILNLDYNRFKGTIEDISSERLGRQVEIRGPIDVDWSLHPTITISNIMVASPDWSPRDSMLSIPRLKLKVNLLELLTGDMQFDHVEMNKPKVTVHRNQQGSLNWPVRETQDPKGKEEKVEPPQIERLTITEGEFTFIDELQHLELNADISSLPDQRTGKEVIQINGQGQVRQQEFQFKVKGGSVLSTSDREAIPLEANAKLGNATLQIEGKLATLPTFAGLSLKVDLKVPNINQFGKLVDSNLPDSTFTFSGVLSHPNQVDWLFRDLEARLDKSNVTGDILLVVSGEKPKLYANLFSDNLWVKDITQFLPEKKPTVAETKQVFTNKPIDFSMLNIIDLDIKFQGQQLQVWNAPVNEHNLQIFLNNGRLRLQPINVSLADGRVMGSMELDAGKDIPSIDVNLEVESIRLSKLLPDNELLDATKGLVGGQVELDAFGRSPAKIAASSSGNIVLMMSSGSLDNLLVEALGIDVGEALLVLVDDEGKVESPTPLHCGVVALDINEGVIHAKTIVADTKDSVIEAKGNINLNTESFDLELAAHPKDPSVLSAQTPITVKGSLRAPDISLEKGELIARLGASIALGTLLSPFAAILPLVEPGTAESRNCTKLMESARTSIEN